MIAPPRQKMTADEFLAWAAGLPREAGRFELWDGQVLVKHAPAGQHAERARHWKAKGAIYRALHEAIGRAGLPCFAVVDGASVRIARDRLAEPDALVYCGEELAGDELEVPAPVIVVEVLSPGSEGLDYGGKVEGYFSIASVAHYLIVDPARPAVVHYSRGAGDALAIRIVRDATLRLDPPGISVALGEVLRTGDGG